MSKSEQKKAVDSPRALDSSTAPDPSRSYERARPEDESGMGRLDNNQSVPTDQADGIEGAVKQKQASRQINAEDADEQRAEARQKKGERKGSPAEKQPKHSMHEEELLGEDLMPTDIHEKRNQRQPRTEGKGGTP